MSDEIEQNPDEVEQITKNPISKPKPAKDPKKVAAGKKLAEYNRQAKQKQKLLQKTDDNEKNRDSADTWLPGTSLTSIISIAGLALTAIDLFLRYKNRESEETEPNTDDDDLQSQPRHPPPSQVRIGME